MKLYKHLFSLFDVFSQVIKYGLYSFNTLAL